MSKSKMLGIGSVLLAVIALGGCASVPAAPNVFVVPPHDKPFDVFARDQSACVSYAKARVTSPVASASDHGAGAVTGMEEAAYGGYGLQHRYDLAYSQCMSAKGNFVPGLVAAIQQRSQSEEDERRSGG
jgi:hypothetical protein